MEGHINGGGSSVCSNLSQHIWTQQENLERRDAALSFLSRTVSKVAIDFKSLRSVSLSFFSVNQIMQPHFSLWQVIGREGMQTHLLLCKDELHVASHQASLC